MIREVPVPRAKVVAPDGPRYYEDAIQKALDGWFVDVGAVIDDAGDEFIDQFATDTYNAIAPHMDLETALNLELVIDPPVYPACRHLFLTRKEDRNIRLSGIGPDGMEYEYV